MNRYTILPTFTSLHAVWDNKTMCWATGPMKFNACDAWIDRALAEEIAA